MGTLVVGVERAPVALPFLVAATAVVPLLVPAVVLLLWRRRRATSMSSEVGRRLEATGASNPACEELDALIEVADRRVEKLDGDRLSAVVDS